MKVPQPLGDVYDRITILRIKQRRIEDPARLEHVARELAALSACWEAEGLPQPEQAAALEAVNEELWVVEDLLREHETRGDFGPRFVELARSVYVLNDRRAALKRALSEALGSELVEVKSYSS